MASVLSLECFAFFMDALLPIILVLLGYDCMNDDYCQACA
jgi:hypothetical protein